MGRRLTWWIDIVGRQKFRMKEATPIIVLGNQKSGTSAIASLLAKATGMSYVIDIPRFWGDEFKRLRAGQSSTRAAIRACYKQFSCDLVKEPNFTFLYPELKEHLPHARFVFVVRHPAENIRSIAERLNLKAEDLLTGTDITQDFSAGWRGVFDDPDLYGAHGGQQSCGEVLALRWRIAASVYLQSPAEFKLLRFEDFASNKINSITQLAEDLGLDACHDISPDINVNYQPAGAKKLVIPRELAASLPSILGDEATRFEYTLDNASRLNDPPQTRAA